MRGRIPGYGCELGKRGLMLRTRAPEVSLWEAVLPQEVLRLPEELARVDALLDDPVFFAPFVPFFDPRVGRPSTPMEVYLRMMFLKFRYRLGYDSLCREVADSITWRRFCRIPLDGRVPHATTLMKLTTRCRDRRGGRLQRGAVGQGGRGEAAAHGAAARGHHGRARGRGLPDRLGVVGQGGAADRRGRTADPGRRGCGADPGARPRSLGRDEGPGDRGEAAAARGADPRPGPGRGAPDHRRAGRAGRTHRHRGREAAAQRPP